MPNTSIALQVQPIRIPDPLESAGRVMSLKQLLGNQQLQGLQMEQARREAAKSAALENLARSSNGNMEQFLQGYSQLDPLGAMTAGMKLRTDQRAEQKGQLELLAKQTERVSQLVSGVLLSDPAIRPRAYAQARMQAISEGLVKDGDPKYPPVYSPQVESYLKQVSQQALATKDALERMDEDFVNRFLAGKNAPQTSGIRTEEMPMGVGESSYVESPEGVPMFDYLTELDMAEGRKTYRRTPEGMEIMPAQGGVPATGEVPITAGDVDTVVDAPESVKLRKKASNLERQAEELLSMRGGEKKAQELRQLANQFRVEANKMDEQIWKEREQQQPVAGAPGITFDRNTGSYLMNGKPISAEQVQEIAAEQRRAGAARIQAAGGDIVLGKAGQTKVDEGLLDTTARKSRLTRVEQSYKPEFLEVGTRLSAGWNAFKEKLGFGINPKDRQTLVEFTQWKQQALDNLNQYIKEITGAALSEPEARRIMSALPNPGQNWYDGDSPTQFKAGMDRAIRDLKTAEARLVYIKRNGLSMDSVPLERMPQIMNTRGAELESVVKQRYPNMGPDEVQATVKRQLAQEFGLTAD